MGNMYVISALLRNAITCLYRNTTSNFFFSRPSKYLGKKRSKANKIYVNQMARTNLLGVPSLEKNEHVFLEKCGFWNLKLNRAKVGQGQSSLKFVGHLLTSERLKLDPEKTQAILQMPEREDIPALRRFLGIVTYLGKFMPHLSEMTTSEAIGGQGCRVPVAGTALQSSVIDKELSY